MVFLFISTVLYFQVYRYGVPVYQYLLCCTSRYFAMVLPSNRQVFGSMSCITSRYIVYGVPVHQYGVVLPGTSLWCSCSWVLCCTSRYIAMVFLFSTVLHFQVHRYGVPVHEYCVVLPGTSLWCSCSSVLCCTSRYIAMMSLFISTVLYFQVHRYGVPVHQYCVVPVSYTHLTLPTNHRV